MRKLLILPLIGVSVFAVAPPANAAFFLEGLRPFVAEPRCNDPYATDKRGCPEVDRAYPKQPRATRPAPPRSRIQTREGIEKK